VPPCGFAFGNFSAPLPRGLVLGRLALHPIFQAFMTWVRLSGFLPCVDYVTMHEICPFDIQIMVHNSSDF
jgi:hypothetical protein